MIYDESVKIKKQNLGDNLIIFIIITSSAFNFINFNNNYHLGDDFAHYIIQSKSIFQSLLSEHQLQKTFNSYSLTTIGPNIYPIGYPLLLKIISFSGVIEIKFFKLINLLVFPIFLYITSLMLKRFSIYLTILGLLFIVLSEEFVRLSSSLEPDLIFGTIGLFIIFHLTRREDKINYSLLIISSSLSLFFKLQGILFIGLIFLVLLMRRKNSELNFKLIIGIVIFYVAILLSPYRVIFGDYTNFSNNFSLLLPNLKYNFQVIVSTFLSSSVDIPIVRNIFILLFFIIFIFNLRKFGIYENYNLIFTLFLLFYSMYVPRQGMRFLFFIIPLFLIMIYRFLENISSQNFYKLLIGIFITINVFNIVNINNYRYENNLYSTSNKLIFQWTLENTDEDSLISFHKPRLLRLETSRKVVHSNFDGNIVSPDFLIIKDSELYSNGESVYNHNLSMYVNIYEIDGFIIFSKN